MADLQITRIRPRLRRSGRLREIINLVVFMIAVYTLLEMASPRSMVQQISMNPTLVEEQRLLISRISYLFADPQRGDIVVFEAPGSVDGPPLIKRLIGLPGETLECRDQSVYIEGNRLEESYLNEVGIPVNRADNIWILDWNAYLCRGDNRNQSSCLLVVVRGMWYVM